MADTKISAMPPPTTPFTGTEKICMIAPGNVAPTFTVFLQQTFGYGSANTTGDLWVSDGFSALQFTGNGSGDFFIQNVRGGVAGGRIDIAIAGFVMQDSANNNIAMFTNGNPCIQLQGQYNQVLNFDSDGNININTNGINFGMSTGFFNSNTNNVFIDANINYYDVNGNQLLTVRQAPIANATGGATIDTQARAAINALLAALRTHGIIGT